MEAKYLAIDGSVVTIEAEAELGDQVTRSGWAVVPSLMQGHPFTVYPSGYSHVMETAVRENIPDIEVQSQDEFSLKGGALRVGVVQVPGNDGPRQVTVGAWEGRGGCLNTSLSGAKRDQLVEVFDTLQFTDGHQGLAIDSPVLSRPRAPQVIQEVPDVGVLVLRPAVVTELERVPRAQGRVTNGGELFRVRSDSNVMLLLTKTCLAHIQPRPDADMTRVSQVVEAMRVEWAPRATSRPNR